MKIEKGKRVRIEVKLQVEDGDVLEESVVEYTQGAGKMLEGLESALEGLAEGDEKSGTIPADKAFGAKAHQHEKKIPRSEFPADADVKVGSTFMAGGAGGQDVVLEITKVGDKELEAVLKHPLAEKNITYKAKVLAVKNPAAPPPPLPSDALELDEDDS